MTTTNVKRYDRLVIVSYRLPFRLFRNRVVRNAGGLVSAILAMAERPEIAARFSARMVWMGHTDDTPAELEKVQEQVTACTLAPVRIEERLNDKYYGGFCNDTLWPLFHYFPALTSFDTADFEAYRQGQEAFAKELAALLRPRDLVWIHDYHLMLLPAMVRERFPNANIGFFLHIPFPSFEILRLMPRRWREALVRGILGADLAGFHTFDYTQYFLQAVGRTLGIETTMNSAVVEDRLVKAETFPLGIDYARYRRATDDPEVVRERRKLGRILGKKKLIFSVDRLDYSKGLLHRLAGFERFLEKYPAWHHKLTFNMVVIPSRESVRRYQDMKKEIEATVGRINGKYGSLTWRPVVYQYQSLKFGEMVALYDHSDIGLITPIRDGMNLVAKEFLACQRHNIGVLILSEMAGAAAELSEAILINPTDNDEVADAIAKALSMSVAERQAVLARMQKRLKAYDVFAWAEDFFDTMGRLKHEQHILSIRLINKVIESHLSHRYRRAVRRIIFLDYDGTLVPFSRDPETAVPDERLLSQLARLARDIRNTVVIVSGRRREFLSQWFGDLPVVLIAEHGAFVRRPGSDWHSNVDGDVSWKQQVRSVLERYEDRCSGSFMEEKTHSLVWHYRNADPGISLLRSQELKHELRELVTHDSRLQVMEGHKVIEVKRAGYDKGTVASCLLGSGVFDFVLAIGDDKTDEDLFRALGAQALTIKIGLMPSLAKYNLADQQEVAGFMKHLLDGQTRADHNAAQEREVAEVAQARGMVGPPLSR
jgi:trehalose 6-phosphate synthase/phosphatase